MTDAELISLLKRLIDLSTAWRVYVACDHSGGVCLEIYPGGAPIEPLLQRIPFGCYASASHSGVILNIQGPYSISYPAFRVYMHFDAVVVKAKSKVRTKYAHQYTDIEELLCAVTTDVEAYKNHWSLKRWWRGRKKL